MSEDEYEVPLLDQRYFGAGIKRKRINFVSASAESTDLPTVKKASTSAADKYLSIVLAEQQATKDTAEASERPGSRGQESAVCSICQRTLEGDAAHTQHTSSLVHQICLSHSHPPSHVNRNSKALAVLQSQGWDPDSRQGLGASGEGILHPIKAIDNATRTGLGATPTVATSKPKPVRLDAGRVRKLEKQTRKQTDHLRNLFYRSEELDKYLGD